MESNLSFGEIFKESIEFFQRNAKNIIIGYLAVALATSLLFFLPEALRSFMASAVLMIFIAAVYHGDKSNTGLSIDTLKTLFQTKFLSILALLIVLAVVYAIGLVLLILPGIYAMIVLQFAGWIMLFKPETKFFETLSESHSRAKGRIWQIFLINLLAGIVIIALFGIALMAFSFTLGIIGLGSIVGYVTYILTLIISVLSVIFQLFLYLRVEASYNSATQV